MTMRRSRRRLAAGLVSLLFGVLIPLPVALAAGPPIPSVSVAAPAQPLIGEAVGIDVTFTNGSTTDTGYGPYVDLRLPLGADGNDGLTFTSATYLGAAVTATPLTADGSGCVTHPYAVDTSGAHLRICGLPVGQSYVVLRLPFGSFTPGQPAAIVHVTAQLSTLADAGTALTIGASGGFQFGADPLANPAADPSITGSLATTVVTPTIVRVAKTYAGPEDETATGPSFPRAYTLTATVAPGQTVTNLVLTDTLPGSLQYVSLDATSPASSAVSTPSTTVPGGALARRFASVTGTGGTDATVTFHFYVPRLAAGGAPVLPAVSGAFVTSTDSVGATASWTPTDPRDAPTAVSAGPATHTLTDKSVAIQKSVALAVDTGPAGVSPGDTLQWTLQVQVSDFFALQGVVVDDRLLDGTRVDGAFAPTLAVAGNGFASGAAAMDAANVTVSPVEGSGTTPLSFRVADELVARGHDGRLVGGCIDPADGSPAPDCDEFDDGGTTVTIVFRSIVQQTYVDGTTRVVEGDALGNLASVTGNVLNTGTFAPTGASIGDGTAAVATAGTSASISIPRGTLAKSIYAIDGNTTFSSPVHVSPGDTVTYRLVQTFPTSRTADFRITDYLPLPIFAATTITTFDPTASAVPPPSGTAKYGPGDTFHLLPGAPAPTIATSGTANSVEFLYGDYAVYPPAASTADLLVTVTVSSDPFADGLLLTNQARSQTRNAAGALQTADAIVQITLDQPDLSITKGVVATTGPRAAFSPATRGPVSFVTPPGGSCPAWTGGPVTSTGLAADPVDSNLAGVDAGDLVRFAVVVENAGHAAAYQVRVADTLPAGFVVPAGGLDLCITDGSGTAIASADLGGGLFGSGLQLVDGPAGALAEGVSGSTPNATGTNVAVVTYTLEVAGTAVPAATIHNTATLLGYTNATGAVDHLAAPLTDDATVTLASPSAVKAITATNQAHTTTPAVAIGEIVTYQVTLTVPEGTLPGATLTDTLPAGMTLVDCSSVAASPDVATTLGGGFGDACLAGTNPTVAGQVVTFDLGTVTNANRADATAESVTVTYRTVITNVASNTAGKTLHNSAALAWTGGAIAAVSASDVRVVEPAITITKTPAPTTGDAGDTITYTVSITNPTGANGATAMDVTWSDTIPSGLTYVPSSLAFVSGTAPTTLTAAGATMTATWPTLGQSATPTRLTYQATLDADVPSGNQYHNTATVTWTSLPGDVRTPLSTFSAVSVERTGSTGDPGGAANTYVASAVGTVTVTQPAPVKTLVATSESGTTGTRVEVGEMARFRVEVRIPEGVTPSVTIVDALPSGLRFLNDGTATVALVADGGGMTSSTLAGAGLAVSGNETTVGTITPTFVIPAGSISGAPFNDGTDPTFALGSLTNADSDANAEVAVIEFNVLAGNTVANQSGRSMSDRAAIYTNGAFLNQSAVVALTLAEPSITFAKVLLVTPTDAGDAVSYRITVTNASGANVSPAYDLRVLDVLDGALVPGSVTITGSGGCTDGSAGALVDVTCPRLDPGTSATITVTAAVGSAVDAGLRIPNTATAAWSSLPGGTGTTPNATGSTTPGAAGTATGERTGVDGPGGALNDYAATASAPVTLAAPSIQKFAPVPATATIGATTTFDLVVTLPEGTTRGLAVIDTLPAGLAPVSTTVVADTASSGGRLTADFSGTLAAPIVTQPGGSGGGPVTLAFGDTVVPADGDATNDRFLVRVTARVANVVGNQNGLHLTNSAGARYADPANGVTTVPAPQTRFVAVVEPAVRVTKSASPVNPHFGDVVTYTLVVDHAPASTTDAFDITLSDTLPAGLTYVAGSLSHSAGLAPTTFGESGGTVSATFATFLLGSTSTLTYQATVAGPGSVALGQVLVNGASTAWTSLAGTDANERTGADGLGGALNDYVATTTAPITIGGTDLSITKDDSRAQATAGATLAYALGYHNAGNVAAAGTTITETVPAHTTFAAASSTAGWSCADGAAAGTTCTRSLGAVAAGASGSVTFAVSVDDPLPPGATAVSNTATIADDGAHGVDPTPANNSATDLDTIPQADLSLAKTVDIGRPNANQVVTFTITLADAGPDAATNVVVTDVLPAGLVFVGATPSQGTFTAGTGRWAVGTVAADGSATLAIRARVTASASVTNTAQVTRSDQVDPDSTPGNGDPAEDDLASAGIAPLIADLGVTKAVDVRHPDVGATVTFTIVATNHGPDGATGVVVHDALPAGLALVSATPSVGAYDAGSGDWSVGALASDATASLALEATVTSPGAITNTATIAGDPFDPNPANNTASASLDQLVDLAVTKSVDDPTPNVGTIATFSVGVANLGPGTAQGVVVRDVLPAGLTFVSASPDAGTYDDSTGDWTVGTLAPDGSSTLTIRARVTAPTPATNTAIVHAVDEPQASTANDSASASVTPPQADLAVTKSVDQPRPDVGDTVTYTVTLTNNGPDGATGVALSDLLPASMTFVDATASRGTYDAAAGSWTVGALANGASATLTIRATVAAGGDVTNTAAVSAVDQYDPDPANNSADAFLTTRVTDVGVTKTVDDPAPAVGATATYTITATNNGPDPASHLLIRDRLPAGLSFADATASQGAYDPTSGDWSVGGLAVGSSATLTLRAVVTDSGSIVNTASVHGLLQRDTDPANDSASATIVAPPAADLALTKTADVTHPDRGGHVTFTLTLTNNGPDDTTGVVVHDALPAGLTFLSATPSAGAYDSATGDWTVGDVADGAAQTLAITVTVDTIGVVTNTAEVTASGLPDPNSTPANDAGGENDQASATLNGRGVADLVLTKRVAPSTVKVGGLATYTLVLTNRGPDAATHVIVRDLLPAKVVYVRHAGGHYDHRTGAWTVGTLAAGRSVTLRITVRVSRSGAIVNTAEVVASDQADPNSTPGNNDPAENDQADAILGVSLPTLPPTAIQPDAGIPVPGSSLPVMVALMLVGLVAAGSVAFVRPRRR